LSKRDVVVGLDVGTTKVAAVVAGTAEGAGLNILGVGTATSRGLKKGVVVDIENTVKAITEAVGAAERMAGSRVKTVFCGVAGAHISSLNNRGVVAVAREDKEITPEDVDRVIEAARVISMPPDREVVHVIPREFVVDGYDGIRDPVGMLGMRLEVEAHIVTGAVTSIQNLLRSVYRAGLEVEDVILVPLASGEAVLEPAERELGVVIVDIGGGTTDIAIFREGTLWFTAILPVGGDHITSDIAVGLRTPIPQAEKVKIEHGVAAAEAASDEEFLDIPSVGGREPRQVSQRVLASIIEPRAQEVFGLVAREIKRSGFEGIIPGGVVVTGGTALLPHIVDVAAAELDLPVRVGTPLGVHGLIDGSVGPAMATSVGLVRYALSNTLRHSRMGGGGGVLESWVDRVRNFFREWF